MIAAVMGTRPRLLDLFCGAGGCSVGYERAGLEVVGVDHKPQPHYPFAFLEGDALELMVCLLRDGFFHTTASDKPLWLSDLDAIHASPPCQAYSSLRHLPWLKDKDYPKLINPVRDALVASGKVWVIENSVRAPLSGIFLCGTMFGLPLYRHRRFECSHLLLRPPHERHTEIIGHGRRVNNRRSAKGAWGNQKIVTVAGGQFKKRDGERAMGIDWMSKPELAQAIPPAYTEWIGRRLMPTVQASFHAKERAPDPRDALEGDRYSDDP